MRVRPGSTAAGGRPRAAAWTGRSLLNASPCRVSDVARLDDASLSYSSSGWDERGRLDDFLALAALLAHPAFGDFWSYVLLAEGAVDLAAEPSLALHDMAAIDVIVREAGGMFTSLDGRPGPLGGNALASNGRLHDQALAFLGALPDDDSDPDEPRRSHGSVFDLSARRRPRRSRLRSPRTTDHRQQPGRDEQGHQVEPPVATGGARRRVADRPSP